MLDEHFVGVDFVVSFNVHCLPLCTYRELDATLLTRSRRFMKTLERAINGRVYSQGVTDGLVPSGCRRRMRC